MARSRNSHYQVFIYTNISTIFKYELQQQMADLLITRILFAFLDIDLKLIKPLPDLFWDYKAWKDHVYGLRENDNEYDEMVANTIANDFNEVASLSKMADYSVNCLTPSRLRREKVVGILNLLDSISYGAFSYEKKLQINPNAEISNKVDSLHRIIPPMLHIVRKSMPYKLDNIIEKFPFNLQFIFILISSSNIILSFLASQLIIELLTQTNTISRKKSDSEASIEIIKRNLIIRDLDIISQHTSILLKILDYNAYQTSEDLLESSRIENGYLRVFGILWSLHSATTNSYENKEEIRYLCNKFTNEKLFVQCIEIAHLYKVKPIIRIASAIFMNVCKTLNDYDSELSKTFNELIYSTSILLLWHIYLLLITNSSMQRNYSKAIISYLIINCEESTTIVRNAFPTFLFRRIDNESNPNDWDAENWGNFFDSILENMNTPTEQWNESCRKELNSRIREEVIAFIHSKMQCFMKTNGKTLLNWNSQEFKIEYADHCSKLKIWHYFLTELISNEDGMYVHFKERIAIPRKFWKKLCRKLIAVKEIHKREKILCAINILYNEHYQIIRENNYIPFIVSLLGNYDNDLLFASITELLYNSIKIPFAKIAKINMRYIIDSNALDTLAMLLGNNSNRKRLSEKLSQKGGYRDSLKAVTSLTIKIKYYIIEIFSMMINLSEKQGTFPLCYIKQYLSKSPILNFIVQTLLQENAELRKETIKLISAHFADRNHITELLKTGITDILILLLDSKIGSEAYSLLKLIERNGSKEVNNDISIDDFDVDDQKIILQCSEVKNSIFLRYLPPYFLKAIEDLPPDQILALYRAKKNFSNFNWNQDMKLTLVTTLSDRISSFLCGNDNSAQDNVPLSSIPIYSRQLNNVMRYPKQSNSIMCAEVNLNEWVKPNNYIIDNEISQIHFIESLRALLLSADDKQSMSYIGLILKSCSLAHQRINHVNVNFIEGVSNILNFTTKQNSKLNLFQSIIKQCIKLLILEVKHESSEDDIGKIVACVETCLVYLKQSYVANNSINASVLTTIKWLCYLMYTLSLNKRECDFSTSAFISDIYTKTFLNFSSNKAELSGNVINHKFATLCKVPKYRNKSEYSTTNIFKAMNDSKGHAQTYSCAYQMEEIYLMFIQNCLDNKKVEMVLISGIIWRIIQCIMLCTHPSYEEQDAAYKLHCIIQQQVDILCNVVILHQEKHFISSLRNILGSDIVQLINSVGVMQNEQILYDKNKPTIISKIMLLFKDTVESPERIWNPYIKVELNALLNKQIQSIENGGGYLSIIAKNKYSYLSKYSIIDGLIIDLYIKSVNYCISRPEERISILIDELEKIYVTKKWLYNKEYCEKLAECLEKITKTQFDKASLTGKFIDVVTGYLLLNEKPEVMGLISPKMLSILDELMSKHAPLVKKLINAISAISKAILGNCNALMQILELLRKHMISDENWVATINLPIYLTKIVFDGSYSNNIKELVVAIISQLLWANSNGMNTVLANYLPHGIIAKFKNKLEKPSNILQMIYKSYEIPNIIWEPSYSGIALEHINNAINQVSKNTESSSAQPISKSNILPFHGELSIAGIYVRIFNIHPILQREGLDEYGVSIACKLIEIGAKYSSTNNKQLSAIMHLSCSLLLLLMGKCFILASDKGFLLISTLMNIFTIVDSNAKILFVQIMAALAIFPKDFTKLIIEEIHFLRKSEDMVHEKICFAYLLNKYISSLPLNTADELGNVLDSLIAIESGHPALSKYYIPILSKLYKMYELKSPKEAGLLIKYRECTKPDLTFLFDINNFSHSIHTLEKIANNYDLITMPILPNCCFIKLSSPLEL